MIEELSRMHRERQRDAKSEREVQRRVMEDREGLPYVQSSSRKAEEEWSIGNIGRDKG